MFQTKFLTIFIFIFSFPISTFAVPTDLTAWGKEKVENLNPVILVHGFIGSKMYLSGQNIQYPANHKCQQGTIDFHKSWISYGLYKNADCEFYWMGLDFNKTSGTFEDRPGVNVQFHDQDDQFGSIEPIQCLWWDKKPFFNRYCIPYFMPLVNWLEAIGYSQAQNLFGAVYDWRLHPASPKLDEYYKNLTATIETAVNNNGGKKAILMAHSYGNIIVNHFLKQWTTAEWRQKHIESTVNIAAPFGGSVPAIHNLLFGAAQKFFRYTVIGAEHSREFLRSLASPAILMPKMEAFNNSQALLQIGEVSYSVENLKELLELADADHLWDFHREHSISDNGEIPMHCVYGTGIDTKLQAKFESMQHFVDNDQNPSEIIYGNGDGSVNIESLRVCQQWQQKNSKITVKELPNEGHETILASKRLYEHLNPILLGKLLQKPGEQFATVSAENLNFTHPSGHFCIAEQMHAKCVDGKKPNRFTKKMVKYSCFDGQQLARIETIRKLKGIGEAGMFEHLQDKAIGHRVEQREELVPLTCI